MPGPGAVPRPDVAARLAVLTRRLDEACGRAGRVPGSVTLVAVSKYRSREAVAVALDAGQRDFAESRVQEARAKWPPLRARHAGVRLHLVGPVRTGKATEAVLGFDVLHSVDRPALAAALAAAMARTGRRPDCYVQVDTGGGARQSGVPLDAADAFLKECREVHRLPVVGLMCQPPSGRDPRPHFRLLRALAAAHGLAGLSMGTSEDFEAAVGEGATVIRTGRALFGPRPRRTANPPEAGPGGRPDPRGERRDPPGTRPGAP
ncbi:YggS family pyridoxal phosphate-dependent enzyme [Streptomyces sp. Ru73]|nr:YggS family pyridoxal phosphate-dependent enzyme [Streptomyces sp. Ru73]